MRPSNNDAERSALLIRKYWDETNSGNNTVENESYENQGNARMNHDLDAEALSAVVRYLISAVMRIAWFDSTQRTVQTPPIPFT